MGEINNGAVLSEALPEPSETRSIAKRISEVDLDNLERYMDEKYGQEWGFSDHTIARPEDTNECSYMIPGTLSLIDKLVTAWSEDDPYDSVIFLDKSARPGAFLYNQVLRKLKEKELLPEGFTAPEIKYMDVGKVKEENKIKSPFTAQLLRESLPPEAVLGNNERVLIVDEFRDTGSTLANARAEFHEVYRPQRPIEGTYQFANGVAPFWYRSPAQKLMADAEHSDQMRKIDRALVEQDTDLFDAVGTSEAEVNSIRVLTDLPRTVFVDLFESRWDDLDNEVFESDQDAMLHTLKERVPEKEITPELEEAVGILSRTQILVDPESFYDYFKYAGGRLARPRRDENREKGFKLRRMLSDLSQQLANKIEDNSKI